MDGYLHRRSAIVSSSFDKKYFYLEARSRRLLQFSEKPVQISSPTSGAEKEYQIVGWKSVRRAAPKGTRGFRFDITVMQRNNAAKDKTVVCCFT